MYVNRAVQPQSIAPILAFVARSIGELFRDANATHEHLPAWTEIDATTSGNVSVSGAYRMRTRAAQNIPLFEQAYRFGDTILQSNNPRLSDTFWIVFRFLNYCAVSAEFIENIDN